MYTTTSPTTSTMQPVVIINNGSIDPVDYHYLGSGFNIGMLTVNLILAAIAIRLNLAVMSFYRSKIKDHTISFIYFTLSTSDLLTGISGALHSIIFLFLLIIGPANSPALFYIAVIAYFITVVSFRVSAFVSLVFAVITTVELLFPKREIKHVVVIIAVITHLVIWVGVLVSEMTGVMAANDSTRERLADFLVGFLYSSSNVKIAEYLYDRSTSALDHESRLDLECGLSLLYTGVAVSFLASLAFMATIVQVVYLAAPERNGAGVVGEYETTETTTESPETTTIFITMVFVLCSSLVLFQPLFIDCSNVVKAATNLKVRYMLQYSFGYLPFFLNAALNPLILFARVKKLRSYRLM